MGRPMAAIARPPGKSAAHHTPDSHDRGREPVFPNPPSKLTRPPVPPPRACPRTEYQLPPPPPPSEPSWRIRQAGETPRLPAAPEYRYRGPRPSMPKLTHCDPWVEFVRLKTAQGNLLPPKSTETSKYRAAFVRFTFQMQSLVQMLKAYLAVCLKYKSQFQGFDGPPTPRSTEEKQDEDTRKVLEKLQRDKQCKICMDRDLCMAFIPCGHLVCCQNCSEMLTVCPICCRPIEQNVKTYMC